jgi:hypothetical protein
MPFSFSFFFFFWLYIWGFFLFLFPFQFCSFQKFQIFFVATVRKLFRPEKKEAGLYRSKKAVLKIKRAKIERLVRFSIARIRPKFKKKRQTFIHVARIN